jgi:hypothetical protein
MKQIFTFKIGKVYIGSTDPFEVIKIDAYNVRDALNKAANYLRPNHLQTLTVIGQPTVEYK